MKMNKNKLLSLSKAVGKGFICLLISIVTLLFFSSIAFFKEMVNYTKNNIMLAFKDIIEEYKKEND